MELLNNLGVNGKLLLAQLVNFAILIWVLHKFAYGPILNLLETRTKKIEKGLKDAEKSQRRLAEIEEKEEKVLVKARKKAQEIIKKAEGLAVENANEIVIVAKEQTEKMLDMSQKQIKQEKEKILREVKSEIATLVVSASEKIIGEKLDNEKDQELIKDSLK